jgi:hypothetical protein
MATSARKTTAAPWGSNYTRIVPTVFRTKRVYVKEFLTKSEEENEQCIVQLEHLDTLGRPLTTAGEL